MRDMQQNQSVRPSVSQAVRQVPNGEILGLTLSWLGDSGKGGETGEGVLIWVLGLEDLAQ